MRRRRGNRGMETAGRDLALDARHGRRLGRRSRRCARGRRDPVPLRRRARHGRDDDGSARGARERDRSCAPRAGRSPRPRGSGDGAVRFPRGRAPLPALRLRRCGCVAALRGSAWKAHDRGRRRASAGARDGRRRHGRARCTGAGRIASHARPVLGRTSGASVRRRPPRHDRGVRARRTRGRREAPRAHRRSSR